MTFPNPGSHEAVAQGCLCPVLGNNHGKGFPWPERIAFWIAEDCPLHSGVCTCETQEGPVNAPGSTIDLPDGT